jgi:hypothetical protein
MIQLLVNKLFSSDAEQSNDVSNTLCSLLTSGIKLNDLESQTLPGTEHFAGLIHNNSSFTSAPPA